MKANLNFDGITQHLKTKTDAAFVQISLSKLAELHEKIINGEDYEDKLLG